MTGREPMPAYVAVGSDVRPGANVPAAVEALQRHVTVVAVSTLYRTAPVGPDGEALPGREAFVNGVLALRTAMPARELKFDCLRAVEAELGRVRSGDAYAPRPIDLDLILHGRTVVDEPGLRLPADDLDRPFVALPLLELAPSLTVPGTDRPLSELAGGGGAAMEPDRALTARVKELLRP